MKITVETDFKEVFNEFIKQQWRERPSERFTVADATIWISEIIELLPDYSDEANAIIGALKHRNEQQTIELVKEGLSSD